MVKLLVENGADMQARTTYGERARESALRYGHIECVDYLDWAGKTIHCCFKSGINYFSCNRMKLLVSQRLVIILTNRFSIH